MARGFAQIHAKLAHLFAAYARFAEKDEGPWAYIVEERARILIKLGLAQAERTRQHGGIFFLK